MPLVTGPTPRIEFPAAVDGRWQHLRVVGARLHDAVDKALQAAHKLSASEYSALAALAYSDDGGHLRQQILADAIPLNQSSLSRLVGRLEKAGLTERYLCATDRRGVYTQITERGRALVAQAYETYAAALAAALDELAVEPDLAPLVAYLRADPPVMPAR
jgi:DNA-binding MarR family transcriptional regulator